MGNPSKEGKEAVDILADTIGGREMFTEELSGSRLRFEVCTIAVMLRVDNAWVFAVFDTKEPIDTLRRGHVFGGFRRLCWMSWSPT